MEHIDVRAAGMFTPQEEGDCKLTIIIPKEDKFAQDFAFTKLRYQAIRISLVPVESTPVQAAPPCPDTLYNEGIQDIQRGLAKLAQYKLMVPSATAVFLEPITEAPGDGTGRDENAAIADLFEVQEEAIDEKAISV